MSKTKSDESKIDQVRQLFKDHGPSLSMDLAQKLIGVTLSPGTFYAAKAEFLKGQTMSESGREGAEAAQCIINNEPEPLPELPAEKAQEPAVHITIRCVRLARELVMHMGLKDAIALLREMGG